MPAQPHVKDTGDPVLVHADKARRPSHKIRKLREEKWPEAFRLLDPDAVASSPPIPQHVQVAFDDVFGRERTQGDPPRLKLALHYHFKRWCMFQRIDDPKNGGGSKWEIVSMFQEAPEEGLLPPDLDHSDKRFEMMRGRIGRARMPTRRDFELIAQVDPRRTVDEIEAALDAETEEAERDYERRLDDQVVDQIEYQFNAIKDGANQDAGSGFHMRSTPSRGHVEQDPRLARKRTVVWNGKKVTFAIGSRFEAAYEADMAGASAEARLKAKLEEERLQRVEADLGREHLRRQALAVRAGATAKNGRTL